MVGSPTTTPPRPAAFDVVGLGEISVDEVVRVAGSPSWGAKARVRDRQRLGGGQVATAMVALRRLGLRAAIIGAVGDDAAGREAVEGLGAEGVDTRGVRTIDGARTRTTLIVVCEDGSRTVIADEDERLRLSLDPPLRELAGAGRVLHVDGTQPQAALQAAEAAHAAGRLVSCDLEAPGDDTAQLLPLVDLCLLAETWAAGDEALVPPRVAASGLVVMTHGERGARAWTWAGTGTGATPGAPLEQPSFAVSPVVDTTACGDTFRAAFLAAHLEGRDLAACLRFACAAAALKVRDLGRRGCPRRHEVERLLGEGA